MTRNRDPLFVDRRRPAGGNATNVGGGALTDGDSFQLFNAATYAGAFDDFILPPLAGGLDWSTNTLNVSGRLAVVTLTSPTMAGLRLAGGTVVIGGIRAARTAGRISC